MGKGKRFHDLTWDGVGLFPGNIRMGMYRTSPKTPLGDYNCIAWAAGDDRRWWQNGAIEPGMFWPRFAPDSDDIEALVRVFELLGYRVCGSGSRERGFRKVALYANAAGKYEHAARQRRKGGWTSKLGWDEDVRHERAECLVGPKYGTIYRFMKRRVRGF